MVKYHMKYGESELKTNINDRRVDIAIFLIKILIVPGFIALLTYIYVLIFILNIIDYFDIFVLLIILIYLFTLSTILFNIKRINIRKYI